MPQAKGVWGLGSCGISNLHISFGTTSLPEDHGRSASVVVPPLLQSQVATPSFSLHSEQRRISASLVNPDQSLSITGDFSSSKAHQQIIPEDSVPASHSHNSTRTPSPLPCSSPFSLDNSRAFSPAQIPSINISVSEECNSPSQRVPPCLNIETSDIEGALSEWSPQFHQENQSDDLEILYSKIQNPSEHLKLNFSSTPIDNQDQSNPDGIPDKDCSMEQLILKLRYLSSSSPSMARALSLLDNVEDTHIANQVTEVVVHSSSVKEISLSNCPAQVKGAQITSSPRDVTPSE
ncbi:hypothetical protein AVEN_40949-1 [Araneus ventricosus]|uniref:Uncharacterized protein n=1 Tax=Araneus ventricosus TaxID=182803 RepID=A0A4Y2FCM7_ARAVE|nr:hypothetical protein AVEN_40949-1 [Araneus ventricosus]